MILNLRITNIHTDQYRYPDLIQLDPDPHIPGDSDGRRQALLLLENHTRPTRRIMTVVPETGILSLQCF